MRLVPKPHMLKSIRSRNWHLSGAIEELVDNSLGHGRATFVGVGIDNKNGIAVIDNGVGADDINRLFRIGDASSHDKLDEIGQYGVGAKNATIYLGDKVTVTTVRDGMRHRMTVDWGEAERAGEWPLGYSGRGQATAKPTGTEVVIRKLYRNFHLNSSERLARELGQVFAPALRTGVQIKVHHRLASGANQNLTVEPYNPPGLTDEIQISGMVQTRRGPLRWHGRAGLSEHLGDRFGVHIAFGHRVIESTKEPFGRETAPTLYAEVTLDQTTPWKHSLSEHKDKVVHNRDALMASIGEQIAELIAKSARESSYLALRNLAVPIENKLTKALKAAGAVFVDPDQDPDHNGGWGETDTEVNPDGPRPRLRDKTEDGEPAKMTTPPSGVQIAFLEPDQLDGKLYDWDISAHYVRLELDEEQFASTVGWPPKVRDRAVIQIIASLLASAIVVEYRLDPTMVGKALTTKLRQQLDEWDSEDARKLQPRLARAILDGVEG